MTFKTNALLLLAMLTGVLTSLIAISYIWISIFEKPFVIYKNMPFDQGELISYKSGQLTKFVITKCNSSDHHVFYNTAVALVNENNKTIVAFPEIPLVAMPGCRTEIAEDMRIPLNTPDGIYHFYGISSVSGGYSYHDVKWQTQPFKVKN